MTSGWIGISDQEGSLFNPSGLGSGAGTWNANGSAADELVVRGSIVIETRLPQHARPQPLLQVDREGDWPFHLALQAIPGGGLTFLLNQGSGCQHCTTNSAEIGRTDVMRLTYSWDAPARFGQLAVERPDKGHVTLMNIAAPNPIRLDDLHRLIKDGPQRYVAPEVLFVSVSTRVEPVGPMPSMTPDTPIATPFGYKAISSLKRGDTVITSTGETVPVLHRVSRTVPARGCFRPIRLRAPFFGLQQDIIVSPTQRLVLNGSEVEYLFGQESVLVELRHLIGEPSVKQVFDHPTVTYEQLVLPEHQAVIAAGSAAESLYLGRIRRKKTLLASSLLADFDRHLLPEHARSVFPMLNAFDSVVLAEQRVA